MIPEPKVGDQHWGLTVQTRKPMPVEGRVEGVTLSILGYTEERLMKDTRHTFPSLVILFFSRNAAIASM